MCTVCFCVVNMSCMSTLGTGYPTCTQNYADIFFLKLFAKEQTQKGNPRNDNNDQRHQNSGHCHFKFRK